MDVQILTDEEMALLVCRSLHTELHPKLSWFQISEQYFNQYHLNDFILAINSWLSQNNIKDFSVIKFEGDLKSFKQVKWTISNG